MCSLQSGDLGAGQGWEWARLSAISGTDEAGYAVFQIPTTSTPQITYNTPSQNSGYLACNGVNEQEFQYCKYNGYTECECSSASSRRRLLFGGLSYLRPNCRCVRRDPKPGHWGPAQASPTG